MNEIKITTGFLNQQGYWVPTTLTDAINDEIYRQLTERKNSADDIVDLNSSKLVDPMEIRAITAEIEVARLSEKIEKFRSTVENVLRAGSVYNDNVDNLLTAIATEMGFQVIPAQLLRIVEIK